MHTPTATLKLERCPATTDASLRAWDAADELLVQHVHESIPDFWSDTARVLICNDAHGALCCALHEFRPTSWSDSHLSHKALLSNWKRNALRGAPVCLESTEVPTEALDIVLIRIPKTLALLDEQLASIRPLLKPGSVIVAASMVKHLNRKAFTLFEKHIGAVRTSLAKKKARLLFSELDESIPASVASYPDRYTDDDLNLSLVNHANVFCRDRVDLGSRFFIAHMHLLPPAKDIVDLACGNGILGVSVQRIQPQARIMFIDESYQAVASARENHAAIVDELALDKSGTFLVNDGLDNLDTASVDLIVCNPPFHVLHAVAADTVQTFIKSASRCLRVDGQIWLVANRHLPYNKYLKRHFGRTKIVSQNSRYTIYAASAPKKTRASDVE